MTSLVSLNADTYWADLIDGPQPDPWPDNRRD